MFQCLTGTQPVGGPVAGVLSRARCGVYSKVVVPRSATGRRPAKSGTGALPSRLRGPKAYSGTPSTALYASGPVVLRPG